jgi:hypothetical protein
VGAGEVLATDCVPAREEMMTLRYDGVHRSGVAVRCQVGAAIEGGLEAKDLHRGSPGLCCSEPQRSEIPIRRSISQLSLYGLGRLAPCSPPSRNAARPCAVVGSILDRRCVRRSFEIR